MELSSAASTEADSFYHLRYFLFLLEEQDPKRWLNGTEHVEMLSISKAVEFSIKRRNVNIGG